MKIAAAKFDAGNSLVPALAAFLLLVVLGAVAGRMLFGRYEEQAKAEISRDLASTGRLRAAQISSFLGERKGDAGVVSAILGSELCLAWWQGSDPELPPAVRRTLDQVLMQYGYAGALIVDAAGEIRYRQGRSVGLSSRGKELALRALTQPTLALSEIYFAEPALPQTSMLDTFAAIQRADTAQLQGVLVLRGNWDQLFALTQPWPEDSRSAEYMLARRDGANVLFLNQLRHQQQAAQRERVPLSADSSSWAWPAIRAVQGYHGALEAVDYRGQPVLAYTLPVPNTDWSIVVKEDVDEAVDGVRRIETVASLSFLAAAALAFALWWRWLRVRARAAQALRESRGRFEKAFQASPDSITLVRLDTGAIVEVNNSFERFTGYSPAEALGRTGEELKLWTDPAQRKSLFEALQAGRAVSGLEARIRRKDGALRVGVRFATTVQIGGVPHVLSIMRDITEQKRAEEALRASEEKFSKAFHASPDSIALSRLETGEFVEVNEGFENISGYAREEAIGRSATELGLWTQTGQREELVAQLAADGRIQDLETVLRRKDGSERVILISLEMIDVAGEKFMLTIGRDVTDAKLAQQAIEQLNAELEQRVRQRTAQLQTANKELETFSYSVAHDLKGPLRGIDGYSRLLLADYSDKLDDNGRLYLQNVRQAAQQMNQLINDLLAYSRLERRDMQAAAIDPQELLSALLAEHADEIGRRGVAVSLDLDCSSVTADRDGLALALRNLLGNALKFTRDAPQPAIQIRARDSGATCILEVRDNGLGFDMKYHDRIFDIFQRLHRSEDYPGTGIGLAIVKKAMERMGGRVWAESAPGKGAAFYLEIPE